MPSVSDEQASGESQGGNVVQNGPTAQDTSSYTNKANTLSALRQNAKVCLFNFITLNWN